MKIPYTCFELMFEYAVEFCLSVSKQDTAETLEFVENYLEDDERRCFIDSVNLLLEASKDLENQEKYNKPMDECDMIVKRLLATKSTAQRTLDWYIQGTRILSASQFATILKSPRTRGQLVMEKANADKIQQTNKNVCCMSYDIRPFDWGIRFEPVIKQIYQKMTGSTVADLGRLIHPNNSRLAASPDGLNIDGSRKGRLIEFKAPITRKVGIEVPKDYYIQMQIQMEVADVDLCDYFEVAFVSSYGKNDYVPPTQDCAYKGRLFLIGTVENGTPIRYEYPELGNMEWEPDLNIDEIVLEIIPWHCVNSYLKTVERSKEWFASMKVPMEEFWNDVEKAKVGDYELPPSKRAKKEEVCLIIEDNQSPPQESMIID